MLPVVADDIVTVPVPVGLMIVFPENVVAPVDPNTVNCPYVGAIDPIVVRSIVLVVPERLLVNAPVTPILG